MTKEYWIDKIIVDLYVYQELENDLTITEKDLFEIIKKHKYKKNLELIK